MVPAMLAQQIARRDLRNTKLIHQPLGLRSLSNTGRAKQKYRPRQERVRFAHRLGHANHQCVHCCVLLKLSTKIDYPTLSKNPGPRLQTWVPAYYKRLRALPAAAAANATRLRAEAVIVAHDQLRLYLLHRVHRDTHDDQQRRAAEVEVKPKSIRHPRWHPVKDTANQ